MAEKELAQGEWPAMKAMAKLIIAAQKNEIAHFDQWLAKHCNERRRQRSDAQQDDRTAARAGATMQRRWPRTTNR